MAGKLTPEEARAAGFTIDDTCYPWLAYKGPRFRPDEWRHVFTDTEAEMLRTLEGCEWWLSTHAEGKAMRDVCRETITKARENC
jgi:hypothetical protein